MFQNFIQFFSLIACLLGLLACDKESLSPKIQWQIISGRDEGAGTQQLPIYRVKCPSNWSYQKPADSLLNTTLPICEFYIQEEEETLRLTIHNFPYQDPSKRIPPLAQVTRWKKQFDSIDPLKTTVSNSAHGGFSGLCLEAEGTQNGKPWAVLAWSMQLALEYERVLSLYDDPLNRQKRGDYTIKAFGSPLLLNKYKPVIQEVANSFELIDELPL